MWINRGEWEATKRRLNELEEIVRDLQFGPKVYFSEGSMHAWSGGKFRLTDALNLMAKHLGVRWDTQPEVECSIKVGSAVGKGAKHEI